MALEKFTEFSGPVLVLVIHATLGMESIDSVIYLGLITAGDVDVCSSCDTEL